MYRGGERYVNKSFLVKAAKEGTWEAYIQSDAAKTFLAALSASTKVPLVELVVVDKADGMTWIHMLCAYNFASTLGAPADVAAML